MKLHPGYPIVTKGHKLTGVTPVAKTDQNSQVSHLSPNQEWCSQVSTSSIPRPKPTRPSYPNQIQPSKSQLIVWKVHVAHDREHGCQDSLYSAVVVQLYPYDGHLSVTKSLHFAQHTLS
jgi:hypothetical protein